MAHIVVSKYDDHLPLYRQAEIFAREGFELETSALSGWVGATSAVLQPLIDALAADVMGSDTLHVDDTPVCATTIVMAGWRQLGCPVCDCRGVRQLASDN